MAVKLGFKNLPGYVFSSSTGVCIVNLLKIIHVFTFFKFYYLYLKTGER